MTACGVEDLIGGLRVVKSMEWWSDSGLRWGGRL